MTQTFAETLWDWPSGFHSLLDRYRLARPGEKEVAQLYKTVARYCGGYGPFKSDGESSVRTVVREEMLRYLRRHGNPHALRGRALGADRTSATSFSVSEAARVVGVSVDTIKSRVRTGEIKASKHGVRRSNAIIEASDLDLFSTTNNINAKAVGGAVSSVLSLKLTLAALGISRRVLIALEQAGIVSVAQRLNRLIYDKSKIGDLIAKFGATEVSEGQHSDTAMTLTGISQHMPDLPLGRFVEAILDGTVKPARRGSGVGLNVLEFERNAVAHLRWRWLAERGIIDGPGAEALLGCRGADLKRLREAGVVQLIDCRDDEQALTYDLNSVIACVETYVFPGEICWLYGRKLFTLDRTLRDLGIRPIVEANRLNQMSLWSRSQVEASIGPPIEHQTSKSANLVLERRRRRAIEVGDRKSRGGERKLLVSELFDPEGVNRPDA